MRPSRADQQAITDLTRELATIQLEESSLDGFLAQTRALLEVETLLIYSVQPFEGELERWHQSGGTSTMRQQLTNLLASSSASPFFYDVFRPAPNQRNRVVEATAWIDRLVPGTWHASRMCQDIMKPMKLENHKQLRALVCEGPALLAWFGAIHPTVTERQVRLLSSLVNPLVRRLSVERRLQGSPRSQAALEVALDHIGAPAFVIGARGQLNETNSCGRALLAARRDELKQALRDAVARRPTTLRIELFALYERGAAASYLAIVRTDTVEGRIAACVRACTSRWGLTRRQTEVLELVSRGMPNATIAATLDCGERAVELHMTALFDRAGVDGRAALVARVLTSIG